MNETECNKLGGLWSNNRCEHSISKEDFQEALTIVGNQNRLGHPNKNQIVLANYYFPDIDSGLELESCEECTGELWDVLINEVKNGRRI